MRAAARVDLTVLASNLEHVMATAAGAQTMAVVKADAYGHGMLPVARVVREVGAPWLGVAYPFEALMVRAAGDEGRVLAWLWVPGDEDIAACLDQHIDLGVSSLDQLDAIVAVTPGSGNRARIHLKVDTGLGRSGASLSQWASLTAAAKVAHHAGKVEIVAVWSHLANGELPDDPSVAEQHATFLEAASVLDEIAPAKHLANSGAIFAHPELHHSIVRCGIAMYGLNPGHVRPNVRPAMTLESAVALTKRVPKGHGVSYGHAWRASNDTNLALVPLGYGDGIPRNANSRVRINNELYPIVGRVAMDQFVVELGDDDVPTGARVVVFGDDSLGDPTADEFAQGCGTIGYEIVTRISARVPRMYVS